MDEGKIISLSHDRVETGSYRREVYRGRYHDISALKIARYDEDSKEKSFGKFS